MDHRVSLVPQVSLQIRIWFLRQRSFLPLKQTNKNIKEKNDPDLFILRGHIVQSGSKGLTTFMPLHRKYRSKAFIHALGLWESKGLGRRLQFFFCLLPTPLFHHHGLQNKWKWYFVAKILTYREKKIVLVIEKKV